MSIHELSFIELHGPVFMQGVNLSNKINAAQRGAKLFQDDERGVVWIYYKNKLSFFPLSNIASADVMGIPEDIGQKLGILANGAPIETSTAYVPPARRGRPPAQEPEVPTGGFAMDPNDPDDAAAHRARVRAASANSNRPVPVTTQNDLLVQEARAQAAGIKTKAQVSNPTKPSEGLSSVQGKPKAVSHAQLKAQTAVEAK